MSRSGVPSRTHWVRGRQSGVLLACLAVVLLLSGCSASVPGSNASAPVGVAAKQSLATPTVKAFDPSVGAPLPGHRIVAIYGIVGGVDFNGAASTLDMLQSNLSRFQDLANQYQQIDPLHPTQLALDLVVNTLQPCSAYPQFCASWVDDGTLQQYVDFCQQHNMLLFFDLQLGTEPVTDAITKHLMTYLTKYPFTEIALDTEFHFPNTPAGYQSALNYPCCLGSMPASEINWTFNEMAQIEHQYHLPRKVVVIHEWNPGVLDDEQNIKPIPDVSVVLQSDGWGEVSNKLGDYQVFDQQTSLEYAGYKLFLQWPDGSEYDVPQQSPADVMKLFPQPLFVSYQ